MVIEALVWWEQGPGFETEEQEAFVVTVLYFSVISNSTQRTRIL